MNDTTEYLVRRGGVDDAAFHKNFNFEECTNKYCLPGCLSTFDLLQAFLQ